jgi:DNA-binding response OmpR family regulator
MCHILVVEDDPSIAMLLVDVLADDGYTATAIPTAIEAFAILRRESYDLILLDVMLPGLNGLEACRRIRQHVQTPIIFLSALGTVHDRIAGLEAGGDDYLPKPFDVEELRARVEAALRRTRSVVPRHDQFITSDVILHPDRNQVTLVDADTTVVLTPTETRLLRYLMLHAGQVLTHEHLSHAVWGYAYERGNDHVAVHIKRLRAKIEVNPRQPRLVQNVYGVGYVFHGRGY